MSKTPGSLLFDFGWTSGGGHTRLSLCTVPSWEASIAVCRAAGFWQIDGLFNSKIESGLALRHFVFFKGCFNPSNPSMATPAAVVV